MPKEYQSIDQALKDLFGNSTKTVRTERVSGGDINDAYRLSLNTGSQVFLKTNKKDNKSFFKTEAAGLAAIAKTGTIGTPEVYGLGVDENRGCAFLLMEYIAGGRRSPDYWEVFAHELAALHQAQTAAFVSEGKFGFYQDNYIGAGYQKNEPRESWISFFRDCRLQPQFERASHYFEQRDKKQMDSLLEHLADYLIEPEHPSLLHGDLWSGNVILGSDGKLWLIDPAVSVGHREADLAMTELFGGFPQAFYTAYQKAAALQPGYENRRDLYNLYHLLNHLNLFGSSYLASVVRTLRNYGTR